MLLKTAEIMHDTFAFGSLLNKKADRHGSIFKLRFMLIKHETKIQI